MKLVYVAIDGCPLFLGAGEEREGGEGVDQERGFLVRRAPGHVQYDFAQDILFDCTPQMQEPPTDLPRGCISTNIHTDLLFYSLQYGSL